MNLWMKRAIGVAALGGGLLVLGAGAAGAQEVAADASARLGRPTSAEVRVCADGRVLSRLLGGCGGGTSGSVQAGRSSDGSGTVRARVPRLAAADVSIGTRRGRPGTTVSGQASATRRAASADADAAADTSPRARADAAASLSRPRAARLLELRPLAVRVGVGLLGSSPFTLVGDPATDSLLPTGEPTLDELTGEAPAGIGVLESEPIASGNQVGVDVGDVSPSVPVTVCGSGVGALGDASATYGTGRLAGGDGTAQPSGTGGTTPSDTGNQAEVGAGGVSATVPVTACGNSLGLLGDASSSCGADTSTGGIVAPPPGGRTHTVGTDGPTGTTGTSGIPGTAGLATGSGGDPVTTFAPLRPLASGSGALPFTGAAGDLLARIGVGLLAAGALFVRATRPAAATEGGGER